MKAPRTPKRGVGEVALGTQVGGRRVRLAVQMVDPLRALPDPRDLVLQALGDARTAGQLLVVAAVRVFRGRPTRGTQQSERDVQGLDGVGKLLSLSALWLDDKASVSTSRTRGTAVQQPSTATPATAPVR